MTTPTRRAFNSGLLGTLTAYGLIETLFRHDAFADKVKPVIDSWACDLDALCRDLKGHKLKDTDFQAKLEALYKKVSLDDLIKLIDLDRLARTTKLPDSGARSLGVDLSRVEGLPSRLAFGKQVFAVKKGRSVVPHGHDNMATGFIILRGNFRGRHYDRVADHKDHYLIRPTIDSSFKPGGCSTISDHKDNVHWFTAESDSGFIFNVHVLGYNAESRKTPKRVYVDPVGEKTSGGLIVAKKLTSALCHKKYG